MPTLALTAHPLLLGLPLPVLVAPMEEEHLPLPSCTPAEPSLMTAREEGGPKLVKEEAKDRIREISCTYCNFYLIDFLFYLE